MDIKQLQYLVRIIELGSFSRAAEEMNISPSALSYQMTRLEDELRVRLFDRHSRGVTPTAAGQIVMDRAYKIQNEINNLKADVLLSEREPIGEVILATPPSISALLLSKILPRLKDEMPEVKIALREGVPLVINDLLVHGKVDIAIQFDIDAGSDLIALPLILDRLHLIGSNILERPSGEFVAPNFLNGLNFILPSIWFTIRRDFDQLMRDANIAPAAIIESDAISATKQLVADGVGYAVLPRFSVFSEKAGDELWAIPIADARPRIALNLVYLKHRQLTPAAALLRSMIFEEANKLAERGWGEPIPSFSDI